ncbi:protein GVQW3-like [Odontomachus brunneus]|uniref:protein GVQW3-like n=1 Tax=Odontomachus brunneus TaxID=486640 RepID=UPI0013F1D15C|nr:protein GVQW3-like [Odontomachus brunneus]
MEQRICIKFCFKNGIKCSTALEMLNDAFGESSMNKTSVYKWHKLFQEGREDVEDDERPGRLSTSTIDDNVEKVKKMIMGNRRITIREIANDVNISFSSCQAIFSDVLCMKRVATKFVPKLLNIVSEFLAKNNTVMMSQPPYSPDMALCEFFLFPKLKRTIKGRRFANIEEIKTE